MPLEYRLASAAYIAVPQQIAKAALSRYAWPNGGSGIEGPVCGSGFPLPRTNLDVARSDQWMTTYWLENVVWIANDKNN